MTNFDFFQDFDHTTHFLSFPGQKQSPEDVITLFRMLICWSILKSLFQPFAAYKRNKFCSIRPRNRQKNQKRVKNPARELFRNAKAMKAFEMFGRISLRFSISLLHELSKYAFYLDRDHLYSFWGRLFWSDIEKILLRKVRFLAFFGLLWLNFGILCSSELLELLIF